MTVYEQKKLFNIIETWEDIKNMGMVMSVDSRSRGIYGEDYYIKIKNDILNYINMHDLSEIVSNKFMGYYGGRIEVKSCSDHIYIHVDAWND